MSPQEFLAELKYLKQSLRGNRAHVVRFRGGNLLSGSLGERYATKVSIAGCGDVEFGFNLDYMADAMEQFKKEPSVTVKVSAGSLGPIIIEAGGRNDRALVMPYNLKKAGMAA